MFTWSLIIVCTYMIVTEARPTHSSPCSLRTNFIVLYFISLWVYLEWHFCLFVQIKRFWFFNNFRVYLYRRGDKFWKVGNSGRDDLDATGKRVMFPEVIWCWEHHKGTTYMPVVDLLSRRSVYGRRVEWWFSKGRLRAMFFTAEQLKSLQ